MGCLFALMLGGVSAAMRSFFGYSLWVMVVLGLLWVVAFVVSALYGHHGFGGHGNTDIQFVIAGLAITASLMIPNYNAQKPCNQAKTALRKLADAENEYYAKHKTFTVELYLLTQTQNPEVHIILLTGDERSFIAVASHRLCDKDNKGTPDVFMWDSAKGGLQ